MSKAFASLADLDDSKITFEHLSAHCWVYSAKGHPNAGVVIGDKSILVIDAAATPALARDLIERIRGVSHKPIRNALLTHFDAARTAGASALEAETGTEIIASQGTLELIIERGEEDRQTGTLPCQVPCPALVIGGGQPEKGEVPGRLILDLGGVQVEIWHPGPGPTRGDTVAWVAEEKVLFSGELVGPAAIDTSDAQLEEWPATLDTLRSLRAEALVANRGEAIRGSADVNKALDDTRRWIQKLFETARVAGRAKGSGVGQR